VGIPLFIYAYPLLRGWFGVEFAENGIWVLRILFFHQWFNINHCIGGYILKGIGKLTELLRYAWICSALNIVISLLLIYKFKLIGVALGTTLPFILFEGYILKHLLRHLAVGFKQYFNNIIFPIYLPIFVVITLCWTFFRVNTLNLIGTILGIILTSVGLFAIYIFSLNRDEKKPLLFFLEKYICVR
jgi:O-antigen/teichoic acid export membrane protein